MPKRLVYIALGPWNRLQRSQLPDETLATYDCPNEPDLFARIAQRHVYFGDPSYAKFGVRHWTAEERSARDGVPDPRAAVVGQLLSGRIFWHDQHLKRREELAGGLNPLDVNGLPQRGTQTTSNSKQKKVIPALALVVVKSDRSDYKKEDAAFARLGGGGAGGAEDESWFSFQKALSAEQSAQLGNVSLAWKKPTRPGEAVEYTNVTVPAKNLRRFSVHGGTEKPTAASLVAPGDKNMTLLDYLQFVLETYRTSTIPRDEQIQNLWSCLHQVIAIHRILYLKRMTHGDMHMGNIKVIVVNRGVDRGVICKAFDFGKYESSSDYTRTDLRYLIDRTAVPRHLGNSSIETNKRRARWEQERGNATIPRTQRTDWKHYPLHRIIEVLLHLHDSPLTPGNERYYDSRIEGLVSECGTGFLDSLGRARKPSKRANEEEMLVEAVTRSFEMFANLLVERFHIRMLP